MNKLTIKKSAWHFGLAKKFGWSERVLNPVRFEFGAPRYVANDDFCSYLRHVLLGLAVIGLGVAVFVFYTYCNVLLFVDVFRGKFVFVNGPIRQAIAVICDAILLILLAGRILWKIWVDWGLGDLFIHWRDAQYLKSVARNKAKGVAEKSRDPFYRAAYDTLKHKFCMKIEVTDD